MLLRSEVTYSILAVLAYLPAALRLVWSNTISVVAEFKKGDRGKTKCFVPPSLYLGLHM